MLNKNVDDRDRIARIFLGLILVAYAIPIGFPDTGWNWVGSVGVIPLLTGLLGSCPLYSVVQFSTRR